MKLAVLVPVYEHGRPLRPVVEALASTNLPCLLIDDGSGAETREILEALAKRHPFVRVIRQPRNAGKGAALKAGYREALAAGFDAVIQMDADGQHEPADVPRFAQALRANPDALVLGVPVFDASVPTVRLAARQLSRGLVWLACLSRAVPDPLCGFRGVPLARTVAILEREATGNRMDFEPELAVRWVWEGWPVACLPTRVVYLPGGLSHFSLLRDYPRLALLYTRLVAGMLPRAIELRRLAGQSDVGGPSR